MSTSGNPTASGTVPKLPHGTGTISYAQLFWDTFKALKYRLPSAKYQRWGHTHTHTRGG